MSSWSFGTVKPKERGYRQNLSTSFSPSVLPISTNPKLTHLLVGGRCCGCVAAGAERRKGRRDEGGGLCVCPCIVFGGPRWAGLDVRVIDLNVMASRVQSVQPARQPPTDNANTTAKETVACAATHARVGATSSHMTNARDRTPRRRRRSNRIDRTQTQGKRHEDSYLCMNPRPGGLHMVPHD